MTTVTTQFFVSFLVQNIFILYHFNLSFQWNVFRFDFIQKIVLFWKSFRLNIHYGHFLRNSKIDHRYLFIKIKDVEIRFDCNPNFYSPKISWKQYSSGNTKILKITKQNSILTFQFLIRLALTCECMCLCLLIFLSKFHQFDIIRVNKQGEKNGD